MCPAHANSEHCIAQGILRAARVSAWQTATLILLYRLAWHCACTVSQQACVVQAQKVRQLLRERGLGAVRVGTVDDYQGQEERIIFISTVRPFFCLSHWTAV